MLSYQQKISWQVTKQCYTKSNFKRYGGGKVIKTNELRGVIAKNGYSQKEVAKMIGIAPKTFYLKMKEGVFGSDEIQIMIDKLNIEDPMNIFFAKE